MFTNTHALAKVFRLPFCDILAQNATRRLKLRHAKGDGAQFIVLSLPNSWFNAVGRLDDYSISQLRKIAYLNRSVSVGNSTGALHNPYSLRTRTVITAFAGVRIGALYSRADAATLPPRARGSLPSRV